MNWESVWKDTPRWRKIVAFLMFMSLVSTEQQIMDMLLGKGWDS